VLFLLVLALDDPFILRVAAAFVVFGIWDREMNKATSS
jgi:hypothetical protein